MTESKLRFWEIALLFALAAALMWGSWSLQQQDRLERKMIRLHVIANSDSEADQALKLQVRDRVLTLATDILRRADSREQAERDIEAALPDLQAAAADEVLLSLFKKILKFFVNCPFAQTYSEKPFILRLFYLRKALAKCAVFCHNKLGMMFCVQS